jgi:hypothetical protein
LAANFHDIGFFPSLFGGLVSFPAIVATTVSAYNDPTAAGSPLHSLNLASFLAAGEFRNDSQFTDHLYTSVIP